MARDATDNSEGADRIYIREAAEQLNRRMSTLRKWEQLGVLPKHLQPHRGHRGWRYWTPDQIEGIKQWLLKTDRIPGKGLPHYNPTDRSVDKAIAHMRRPRTCVICEKPIKQGEPWERFSGKAVHRSCVEIEEEDLSESGATV